MDKLFLRVLQQIMLATIWRMDGGSTQDLYPLTNDADIINPPDYENEMPTGPKRDEAAGPRDCAEILDENPDSPSGIYTIYPPKCIMCYYHVFCDMEHEGGGWTVISKRFNGSIDFYRGWYYYKMGFGDINGEYYLGNEKIHQITNQKPYELRIKLVDVGDMVMEAGYSHFYLGNMMGGYVLHIDSYFGDAGDFMKNSNNTMFSTFDKDNDGAPINCAEYFHSAWWYHTYGTDCGSQSNIFGYYFLGRKNLPSYAGPGLSWINVPGPGGPAIKEVTMKIRPMGYIGGSKDAGNKRLAVKRSVTQDNIYPIKSAKYPKPVTQF